MLKKDMIDPTDRTAVMEQAAKYYAADLFRGEPLGSPDDTKEYLRSVLTDEKSEVFCALFLDTRHRPIAFEKLFYGTIDGAAVYPRVVAQKALEHNAAALIIAHNHPSGASTPSHADECITDRIKKALNLLDIRLLDHFIVGSGGPTSMANMGLV